jgi:hypothetical protein
MKTQLKTIRAWHFLPEDRCLRYGDNRLIHKGQTLRVDCKPRLCVRGLHGSKRAIDALKYAPGPIVSLVEIGGEVIEGDDKLVGTERKTLWWADATETLHRFACWCAEKALKSANVTDERSWNAIHVKLKWLKGEATDAELDAAASAASSAAWSAAWSAARSAAWSAAWSAARSAAWSAAWSAARSAQNDKLELMLKKLSK